MHNHSSIILGRFFGISKKSRRVVLKNMKEAKMTHISSANQRNMLEVNQLFEKLMFLLLWMHKFRAQRPILGKMKTDQYL